MHTLGKIYYTKIDACLSYHLAILRGGALCDGAGLCGGDDFDD
jgi:hypothetical protein